MRRAELLGVAGRMQRVGEEEQRIAVEAVGGEERGDPPAHGAPAEDQPPRAVLVPHALHHVG